MALFVNARFTWGTRVTPEQKKQLDSFIGEEVKVDGELKEDGKYILEYFEDYSVDIINFYQHFPDINLEIRGLVNPVTFEDKAFEIAKVLSSIVTRVERVNEDIEKLKDINQLFNAKCNVHVPGLGLLTMNRVIYEVDCCTEHLQDRLDAGWRILAICPQPDQRRPDYILGRNADEGKDY